MTKLIIVTFITICHTFEQRGAFVASGLRPRRLINDTAYQRIFYSLQIASVNTRMIYHTYNIKAKVDNMGTYVYAFTTEFS